MSPTIRPIQSADNERVAHIIRTVMTEFACVGEGYSIEDPEVNDMYKAYDTPRAAFFVVEKQGEIHGCGGFGPLLGAQEKICELKKMYFLSSLRGLGMGQQLLDRCIAEAQNCGYEKMYLETVERMAAANKLYQKKGFKKRCEPEGATGHSGCDSFYEKHLISPNKIPQQGFTFPTTAKPDGDNQ